jgi:DNA sulfur modification protein DndB
MNYTFKFPVVKGRQAKRDYYIAMVPLRMIPKLFPNDEEYVAPEFRAQRKLNETRIPVMVKYILQNRDSYVFSALAASIDGDFNFEPDQANCETGILEVSMDARFLINDGQHRKAAIFEALKEDETLGDETISIVFYADRGLRRSQQIFTDLNKNAVKTSNSISELYDSRDPLAVTNRNIILKNPFLNTYTDKEKDILGKYSSSLFTLHNFYTANRSILGSNKVKEGDEIFLTEYWNSVVENMKPWQDLAAGEVYKSQLREDYIATQVVVIQALGRLGRYYYEHPDKEFQNDLKKLKSINWYRSNPDWKLRAIRENGRIITNQRGIALIANEIKKQLGIPLNNDELQLEKQHDMELALKPEITNE